MTQIEEPESIKKVQQEMFIKMAKEQLFCKSDEELKRMAKAILFALQKDDEQITITEVKKVDTQIDLSKSKVNLRTHKQ